MSRNDMPWDEAAGTEAGPATNDAPRRAAIATWITAGVLLVIFGCCSGFFAALGLMPEDVLREGMADTLPEEQVEETIRLQSSFLGAAIAVLLVMFLPALVLLVLGFRVQAGSLGSARAARAILLAQAVIVAILLAIYVISSIMVVAILELCMTLVLLGGTLVLLAWAVRAQTRAIRALRGEPGDEPSQGY